MEIQSAAPLFLLGFLLIYLVAYTRVFRTWSPKQKAEASSCLISLFHGTPAVVLSTYALLFHTPQNPLSNFASPNTPFQDLVLDFSIAYFTMDLIHYLILLPGEVLFIAHHLATLFVFATSRFLACRGGAALLVLLFLAEVSSPCQNVWTLAAFRKDDDYGASRVYGAISPVFFSLYTLSRGVLGPILVFRMWDFYLRGGGYGLVPTWVWFCWLLVISAAIMVSLVWISNLWIVWIGDQARHKHKLSKVLTSSPTHRLNFGALYLCIQILGACSDLAVSCIETNSKFHFENEPWGSVLLSFSNTLMKAFNFDLVVRRNDEYCDEAVPLIALLLDQKVVSHLLLHWLDLK